MCANNPDILHIAMLWRMHPHSVVCLKTKISCLLLCRGVAKNPGEWLPPDGDLRKQLCCGGQPVKVADTATDIPFPSPSSSPPTVLELTFPEDVAPDYMVFVLHSPPRDWFKQPSPGRPSTNFMLPLKQTLKQILSRSSFLKAIYAYKQTQPLQETKPSSTQCVHQQHLSTGCP